MMGDLAPNRSAFARLGVARMTADVTASAAVSSATDKENSTQAYVGLGVG